MKPRAPSRSSMARHGPSSSFEAASSSGQPASPVRNSHRTSSRSPSGNARTSAMLGGATVESVREGAFGSWLIAPLLGSGGDLPGHTLDLATERVVGVLQAVDPAAGQLQHLLADRKD